MSLARTSLPPLISSSDSIVSLDKYDWSLCTVSNLELRAGLGRGVRMALHDRTNNIFAVKIIEREKAARSANVAKHVMNERNILIKINGHFCLKLYKTLKDDTSLYFVTEYLPNKIPIPCSIESVRFYLSELVLGLLYIHSMGIVHRDIKPSNVLLDKTGHVRIIDFGFATEEKSTTWSGTVHYFSPERIKKLSYNEKADWWSVGCLILEWTTGKPPFFSENKLEQDEMILSGNPHSCSDAVLQDLVTKLLDKNPDTRLGDDEVFNHPFFNWFGSSFFAEFETDSFLKSNPPSVVLDKFDEEEIEIVDQTLFKDF